MCPTLTVREALIAPAAGMLGVEPAPLYRELSDYLAPAASSRRCPSAARVQKGGGASGAQVADSMSKTLLTLDRLRKLLAGDFDAGPAQGFPVHGAGVDGDAAGHEAGRRARAEARKPAQPPARPRRARHAGRQARAARHSGASPGAPARRRGGSPHVRQPLEGPRLLPEFKRQLGAIEPAVLKLTQEDSRFFSDRTHPARQFLDRMTQRSLAFSAENDAGWRRFIMTVEDAVRWLGSKVVDADTFGELMDHLQDNWVDHDQVVRQRREEAARVPAARGAAQPAGAKARHRVRPGHRGARRRRLRPETSFALVGPGGGRSRAQLCRWIRRSVRLPGHGGRPDLERAEEHGHPRAGQAGWSR